MLSPEFLAEMRRLLEDRRKELVARQDRIHQDLESIRDSDQGIHDSLDVSILEQSTSQHVIMRERERKQLLEIDEALHRIEEGEYGVCEVTGEPIPETRLRASPLARFSVEAQEEKEREAKLRNFRPGLLDDM